ncbi:hypothetical protein EHP00_280 [Ecytonucleospora hepatopenaei]|uniref:Uncharacterized protein n=1 Tax=Ecytonucleospora hepatopenaei TaxID=646526 RepID=A0A1W0E7J2_9MICR|nr:hypothetical protein EHP00_280 [Ecytonucleospora hepatopenaei]
MVTNKKRSYGNKNSCIMTDKEIDYVNNCLYKYTYNINKNTVDYKGILAGKTVEIKECNNESINNTNECLNGEEKNEKGNETKGEVDKQIVKMPAFGKAVKRGKKYSREAVNCEFSSEFQAEFFWSNCRSTLSLLKWIKIDLEVKREIESDFCDNILENINMITILKNNYMFVNDIFYKMMECFTRKDIVFNVFMIDFIILCGKNNFEFSDAFLNSVDLFLNESINLEFEMRFYVKEQKDFFESLKYPLGVSLACFLMLRNSKYIEIYKKANYVCKNSIHYKNYMSLVKHK